MRFFGSHEIKDHIEAYIKQNARELTGKSVVDLPAGQGVSSKLLMEAGASVEAFDLFPEFFKVEGLECQKADLARALPIDSESTDFVLCQEGIEHLPDQFFALKELNRILKKDGRLLLTTPNYSNMRSRFSYLFSESEMYKLMPVNEIDSVWFSNLKEGGSDLYFGHVFMIGIQKLRLLAKLAGLEIYKVHHTKVNKTALFLLLLTYPFVLLFNYKAYRRAMRKRKDVSYSVRKRIFWSAFKYGIDPRILTDGHLVVEFVKKADPRGAQEEIKALHKMDI